MKRTLAISAVTALLCTAIPASASDLRFKFTNPTFGGDPLIGTYLFGLADAQRNQTANDADDGDADGNGGIGGGNVTGPTIVIPINPGSPNGPNVGNPTVSQVNDSTSG